MNIESMLIVIPEGYRYVQITGQKEVLDMLRMTDIVSLKEIPDGNQYNAVILDENVDEEYVDENMFKCSCKKTN